MKLEEWGMSATEEQMREMTDRIKALAVEKKRVLSDEEVRAVFDGVLNG